MALLIAVARLIWKKAINPEAPFDPKDFYWGCTGWYVVQGDRRACMHTEKLQRNDYGLMTDTTAPEFSMTAEEFGITLRLTSVCVPRPYAHFRFLTSGGFNNEHQLARHLHSLGGGWEAVAGGMLTLTVPAERASELKRLMYVEGLAPGVLPLEA